MLWPTVSTAIRGFRRALGTPPADPGAGRREAGVARAALAALCARGVGVMVGFLLVPLTLSSLGAERYGVWMTVSSVLAWLYLADLGMGNGLTNALSRALALDQPEVARAHVATAFWLLSAVALAVAMVLAAAWPWLDWAALLNASGQVAPEVRGAVALAVALSLLAFPLSLVERIYISCQEGAIANAWTAGESLLGLAAVFAVTRAGGGLRALVLALAGAHLATSAASAAWLFARHRPGLRPSPSRVSRRSLVELGGSAAQFFLIQIIGVLLFSTDNVIIARILGPAEVAPYSVAAKLFTIPTLFVLLHAPYVWTAYAEASARGDVHWVRRAVRLSAGASFLVALVLAVPLAWFGQSLCRAWSVGTAVPDQAVLWWMAAWAVLYAPAVAASCMLNGMGQLRGQVIYGILAAAANLALSITWARSFGSAGVIAATVVSYGMFAAGPTAVEVVWTLRRRARALKAVP